MATIFTAGFSYLLVTNFEIVFTSEFSHFLVAYFQWLNSAVKKSKTLWQKSDQTLQWKNLKICDKKVTKMNSFIIQGKQYYCHRHFSSVVRRPRLLVQLPGGCLDTLAQNGILIESSKWQPRYGENRGAEPAHKWYCFENDLLNVDCKTYNFVHKTFTQCHSNFVRRFQGEIKHMHKNTCDASIVVTIQSEQIFPHL